MNSNTFGCNTWWTIPELSVDSELAIAIIQKYGFQAEDLKVPSRRLEVSRAVRSFHNRRTNDGRRIGERIRDTDSTVSYGILDRVVGVEEVNFEQGTKIILEKGSGTVTVSGIHKEEFDVALSDSVGKVTDEDVRYFLRRVIKKAYGVAKRPTGGIYFVPESKVEVMENASKCLKEFNTAAHIYIERVMNGVQERENVWESVQSDVESRLAEAVAAVGRIERRASALNNQAEKIGEAQELMEFYQSLLGEEAKYQELAEKIEDAVKIVVAKMDEIQEATSVKVAKVAKVTTRKRKAKMVGKTRSSRIVEAAVQVLCSEKKVLTAHEIADMAIGGGYFAEGCNNPDGRFNIEINRAITKGETRIKKVARNAFAMA